MTIESTAVVDFIGIEKETSRVGEVSMSGGVKHGEKVRLRSFHGLDQAPPGTEPAEDYWKLIGWSGRVASEVKQAHPSFPHLGERVLVKFDDDVASVGLHCHNPTENNALWICLSDLAYEWQEPRSSLA